MRVINFLLILFLFLSCQITTVFSFNPLDENIEYKPAEIENFKITGSFSGAYNDPGHLYFSFSVLDKNKNNIIIYSKTNFTIYAGKKKISNFFCRSSSSNYKFNISRLPRQVKNGTYDLKIELTDKGKTELIYTKKNIITYKAKGNEKLNLILLVDSSGSMYNTDNGNFRIKAIQNIIDYLKDCGSSIKISIIKFGSQAQVLCPLTFLNNSTALINALNAINANGDTNIGDALDKAIEEIKKVTRGEKVVTILLTDGENTCYYNKNHLKFKQYNSPVYTIGLAANVNNKFLNEIAVSTGGEYFKIPDSFKIRDIYLKIVNKELNKKLTIKSYLSKRNNYLNEPVELSVLIFQGEQPILNSKMEVFISSKKTNCLLSLYDDGDHNDNEKNDGYYKNYFFNPIPGDYKVTYKIKGKNQYSKNFYYEEKDHFFTADHQNTNLRITPVNVKFQKVGTDMDYYQSFNLLSFYPGSISTKITPLNLSFSNDIQEMEGTINIKPGSIILEPYKNKLFNINVNLTKEKKNGIYYGKLILTANNDYFVIPFQLDFYKYYIPETSVYIKK